MIRTALLVACVAVGIGAFAVLLTPVLYGVLLDLGWIDEDEFLKVTRRLLLVPAILALFAWLRPWRDGGPTSYGLLGEHARVRPFLAGYGLTLAVGLSVLVWHFAVGWLTWEDPLDMAGGLRRVGRWVLVGFALASMEEWFFRGWMDRRLRRRFSPLVSVLLVAAIYGLIHAFKPSRLDVEVTRDVAGAWTGLSWWLRHLVDPARFGPTFLGLFLFSLVLSAAWRRTRTLWAPIGIHAAGVALLRSYGAFTVRDPDRNWAGTKELLDGPVLWAVLLLALAILTARRSRTDRPRATFTGL